MSYYRIIDGIPGMKDLIVKGDVIDLEYCPEGGGYGGGTYSVVQVEEIINIDVIVGDRQLKFPVQKGMLLINIHSVIAIDDPQLREFTTQSPFGKYEYDGSYKKNEIVVTYVRYENGISITIGEDHGQTGRTLYAQNFFNERADEAEEIVRQAMRGDTNIEDLVFELKAVFE